MFKAEGGGGGEEGEAVREFAGREDEGVVGVIDGWAGKVVAACEEGGAVVGVGGPLDEVDFF